MTPKPIQVTNLCHICFDMMLLHDTINNMVQIIIVIVGLFDK